MKWGWRPKSRVTQMLSSTWEVWKSKTNEQHLIAMNYIQSAKSISYMLNVWQGNRSAISYCVITHSRRVQVQNHTHRHAHFHTRTAVAQSSCIFQQESKHLPVLPTTWQTHVHKHKHAAVLYVHFVQRLHTVSVDASACLRMYAFIRDCGWERVWPEGSWQRELSYSRITLRPL